MSFIQLFANRLIERDPTAIASLRKMVRMHHHGNHQASEALKRLSRYMVQVQHGYMGGSALDGRGFGDGGHSFFGASSQGAYYNDAGHTFSGAIPGIHLVTKPIAWLTSLLGKALTTTGNVATHATHFATRPLYWGGAKLQKVAHTGISMPKMLSAHHHVP